MDKTLSDQKGDPVMRGTTNVVKGRIEEAAGALSGNIKMIASTLPFLVLAVVYFLRFRKGNAGASNG